MSSDEELTNIESLMSFFEERIEAVPLRNGGTVFIQRPLISSSDASDTNTTDSNRSQLYRISIGPMEIVIYYKQNMDIEQNIRLSVPLHGEVPMGSVAGTLTNGITLKVSHMAIEGGEVGVRLDRSSAILHWNVSAFGSSYVDEINLFSI